jgi:hypothetical protein
MQAVFESRHFCVKTVKAFCGYAPDEPLKIDRTAFSMRKYTE